MANQEHVSMLMKWVEVWNKWREDNPDVKPDLSGALLMGEYLMNANLSGANFRGAKLSGADFRGANLSSADLSGAIIGRADFGGANLSNSDFSLVDTVEADLSRVILSITDIGGPVIGGVNFNGAIISGANFRGANLSGSLFTGADLSGAKLINANLYGAKLFEANLSRTDLRRADLREAYLNKADITGSWLYHTSCNDWRIDDIKCDYVYLDIEGKERTPKDRDFIPGEFEELFKQLPTIEYYFENGFTPIDAFVIDKVVQAINEKQPEFELKLDSLHSRGQPHAVFTILHKEYADEAIRQITLDYETRIKVIEAERNLLERLFTKAIEQPRTFIEYNSRNIHVEGNATNSKLAAGDDNELNEA